MNIRRCLLVIFALSATALRGGGRGAADGRPAHPAAGRSFETRRRPPRLAEHCSACHGPDRQRSGLRLDSGDAIRLGGASGEPAVVAGRPDRSRLIRAVRHLDGAAPMPPKGWLSEPEVADLVHWVS